MSQYATQDAAAGLQLTVLGQRRKTGKAWSGGEVGAARKAQELPVFYSVAAPRP